MRKIFLTAAVAALIFAACGSGQNPNEHDGMGAGDGADTMGEPISPNDTSGMAAPIDTTLDTNSIR